jgi:hypothetical protein
VALLFDDEGALDPNQPTFFAIAVELTGDAVRDFLTRVEHCGFTNELAYEEAFWPVGQEIRVVDQTFWQSLSDLAEQRLEVGSTGCRDRNDCIERALLLILLDEGKEPIFGFEPVHLVDHENYRRV